MAIFSTGSFADKVQYAGEAVPVQCVTFKVFSDCCQIVWFRHVISQTHSKIQMENVSVIYSTGITYPVNVFTIRPLYVFIYMPMSLFSFRTLSS